MFARELFKLDDGGTIAIDWTDEIPASYSQSQKPIVVVVPGLSSDNNEIYMLNILLKAKKAGYRGVVINYRGGSKCPMTNGTLYCAGSVNDIRQPLEYIYDQYCRSGDQSEREVPLFLIGNSMGANIVANYVGEEGPNCFLRAAVCVQSPMRMWECGTNIENRLFGFYNYILGQNVKRKIELLSPNLIQPYLDNHGIDLMESLEKSKNLIDIDKNLTSVTFGYGTIQNYYDKASCIHRIPSIKTPTFFLMSKDDPIVGDKAIAKEVCEANPYCLLGLTEQGGHLGYFENATSSDQWFVHPVFEFL